jgi:hypothetical protein
VKHWEIIADNPSKAGFSWGCVSTIDQCKGERSGLQTRIARENVSSCAADEKLAAFLKLEAAAQRCRELA